MNRLNVTKHYPYWALLIIFLVLIGLSGYGVYTLHQANKLQVTKIVVTSLNSIPGQGIQVNGNIEITNPGSSDIRIGGGNYVLFLEETGEELVWGTIQEANIPAHRPVVVSMQSQTVWTPNAETLLRLTSERNVYVTISGEVRVTLFGISLPQSFSKQIDIASVIDMLIAQKRQELTRLALP